jgi:hypothetical protein
MLFIVIFHTCNARKEVDDDAIVVFFAAKKKKNNKIRKEEEKGAYLQAPTLAPLAFTLLLPPH